MLIPPQRDDPKARGESSSDIIFNLFKEYTSGATDQLKH